MDKLDNREFEIRIDEESPDSLLQEKIEDSAIVKLNRRITIATICLICLICASAVAIYIDTKNKLETTHSAGITENQNLESKFSAISSKHVTFEKTISEKITSIKRTIASLDNDIKQINKTINKIDSLKTNKEELTNTQTEIDKALSSIDENAKNATLALQAVDNKFMQKMENFDKASDDIKTELNKLQVALNALSDKKIDKKILDDTLEKKQKEYTLQLNKTEKNLKKKIESIQKQMKKLKKPAPPKIITPEQGTFIEQDIE